MRANPAADGDDIPQVVLKKRRQDRQHLVGLMIFSVLILASVVYLASELGLHPF